MTEVYWNLHKRCFSVCERGRVIAHTDHVTLRNAHFVLQRSGYERTVREKVKSVHAWVRGEVTEMSEAFSGAQALRIFERTSYVVAKECWRGGQA